MPPEAASVAAYPWFLLPSGSAFVVIFNGDGPALIVIDIALVADCWLGIVESCTLNVVEVVSEFVGVPVISPFALRTRPCGRVEPLLRFQL